MPPPTVMFISPAVAPKHGYCTTLPTTVNANGSVIVCITVSEEQLFTSEIAIEYVFALRLLIVVTPDDIILNVASPAGVTDIVYGAVPPIIETVNSPSPSSKQLTFSGEMTVAVMGLSGAAIIINESTVQPLKSVIKTS